MCPFPAGLVESGRFFAYGNLEKTWILKNILTPVLQSDITVSNRLALTTLEC